MPSSLIFYLANCPSCSAITLFVNSLIVRSAKVGVEVRVGGIVVDGHTAEGSMAIAKIDAPYCTGMPIASGRLVNRVEASGVADGMRS